MYFDMVAHCVEYKWPFCSKFLGWAQGGESLFEDAAYEAAKFCHDRPDVELCRDWSAFNKANEERK
jgi:hypothetical protein